MRNAGGILAGMLFIELASAQGIFAGYPPVRVIDYSTGMPYWRGAANENAQALGGALRRQSNDFFAARAPTAVSCNVASASTEMVTHYPEGQRSEAAKIFKQLSAGYLEVMRKLQLPPNDVASAVGAFLVGNFTAYREVDFPDEAVQPLVQQLRDILSNDSQFRSAPTETKSMVCGQLALVCMFMATTRMATKEHPQPEVVAGMRQAAKSYLETFLKTDADRVNISARGLVLR